MTDKLKLHVTIFFGDPASCVFSLCPHTIAYFKGSETESFLFVIKKHVHKFSDEILGQPTETSGRWLFVGYVKRVWVTAICIHK